MGAGIIVALVVQESCRKSWVIQVRLPADGEGRGEDEVEKRWNNEGERRYISFTFCRWLRRSGWAMERKGLRMERVQIEHGRSNSESTLRLDPRALIQADLHAFMPRIR